MKEIFNEARKEYETIKAPKSLRNNIEKIFETKRKSNVIKIAATSIAAAFTLFTFSLNTNETFAKSVSNIAGLDGIVNILTGGRFEVENDNFHANIVTPEVSGLSNKEFEAKLNEELSGNANLVKEAFEKDMAALEADDKMGHLGVEYGYKIRTNTKDIIALDVYVENTVGSSSTVHEFYNIDKKNNKLISLTDWIKDEDYIEKINEYIKIEMKKREIEEENKYFWNGELAFETITEYTKFYINQAGNVVICFDKYDIAPGAYGSIEFEIPSEIFE